MEKILSKIDGSLLHFIVRRDDFLPGRQDLIAPDNFLQCSMLNLNKGVTFKPHQHIYHSNPDVAIAQEAWLVIKGIVRVIYYDTDGQKITEKILYAGDGSFTLFGGHNYLIEEDDTRVYEMKTGFYLGQELDKAFI